MLNQTAATDSPNTLFEQYGFMVPILVCLSPSIWGYFDTDKNGDRHNGESVGDQNGIPVLKDGW